MATDMDYDGKRLFSKYDPITEDGKALMIQPFYSIINTDQDKPIKHIFIDFKYDEKETIDNVVYPVIKGPDIVETEIPLHAEMIEIRNDNKMDSVLEHLNKEFTKRAEIGRAHV